MSSFDDHTSVSRRTLLRASGGMAAVLGAGTVRGGEDEDDATNPSEYCDETTVGPSMVHYDHASECDDDHQKTKKLQADVETALDERFPTVGSLIDAGFIPYFDFLTAEEGAGWSHWLSPAFIGDDSVRDPTRPESVLVDHKWWRPIGVMFIATREGEQIDPPPVYEDERGDGTERACVPWHAHVGLPGRYSWWKYRTYYAEHAPLVPEIQCRTPWMMHVWAYPHPESVYAHAAPPRGSRGGPPAEEAGFETDAVPGEDALGPDVLPAVVKHRIKHR